MKLNGRENIKGKMDENNEVKRRWK